MTTDQDLIIIGAGGAGLSAAQYGARGNLRTLVLEEVSSGGQALLIDGLENYPGFPDPINGYDFTKRFEDQARRFGAQFENSGVTAITRHDHVFKVQTEKATLTAPTVILATGAVHKSLGVPGEAELAGHGVSYCATCDGPFFKAKRMLVVGGGDAACDEAMYLANLASGILMIHRRDKFRAQKSLAARVLANPKIEEIYEELRSLQLKRHPHAIAVLLRVFLETSVDHFMTQSSLSLTFPTANGPKDNPSRKKLMRQSSTWCPTGR